MRGFEWTLTRSHNYTVSYFPFSSVNVAVEKAESVLTFHLGASLHSLWRRTLLTGADCTADTDANEHLAEGHLDCS